MLVVNILFPIPRASKQGSLFAKKKKPRIKMSRAAWITLGASCVFTSTLVFLVHRQQRVEKEVIQIGHYY